MKAQLKAWLLQELCCKCFKNNSAVLRLKLDLSSFRNATVVDAIKSVGFTLCGGTKKKGGDTRILY